MGSWVREERPLRGDDDRGDAKLSASWSDLRDRRFAPDFAILAAFRASIPVAL